MLSFVLSTADRGQLSYQRGWRELANATSGTHRPRVGGWPRCQGAICEATRDSRFSLPSTSDEILGMLIKVTVIATPSSYCPDQAPREHCSRSRSRGPSQHWKPVAQTNTKMQTQRCKAQTPRAKTSRVGCFSWPSCCIAGYNLDCNSPSS